MESTGYKIGETRSIAYSFFFFPPTDGEFFLSFDPGLSTLPLLLKEPAEVLKSNLNGAISTLSMPFLVVSSGVLDRRYQQIHAAESIRALKEEGVDRDALAREKANERFKLEQQSEDFGKIIAPQILDVLERHLQNPNMVSASNELLKQGLVLTWSSFELFVADVFTRLLNQYPTWATDLLRHEDTKKWYGFRDPLKVLEEHDFTFADKMGSLLLSQRRLDDVPTIRAAFRVLLPMATELHSTLDCKELWLLNQRRNLIVHRRGIIDSAYYRNTGDNVPVGAELRVTPHQIETNLKLVINLANQVLAAFAGRLT
jgi:hypothetical protein